MKLLLLPLLLLPIVAFGESQTVPTDGGTLEVRMTYPDNIVAEEHFPLLIEFINPTTGMLQEHIDYIITITRNGNTVFGPTPLTHSTEGALRGLEPAFQNTGDYTINVSVEGILFQPLDPENASLTIRVEDPDSGGGCLIATAAYGSETAIQVQQLRDIRDNVLLSTDAGRAFMDGFNPIYYWFSPTVADMERQNPLFREVIRATMQPMLGSLQVMEYADTNEKVITYGIGIILLNAAIYTSPLAGLVWMCRYVRPRISKSHTNV